MKKIFFIGILGSILFLPMFSHAQTTDDILFARIAELTKMIQALQAELLLLSSTTPSVTNVSGEVLGVSTHIFMEYLAPSSSGNEVSELQKKLKSLKYYGEDITGYYGPVTQLGVTKLQQSHDLEGTGTLNSETRDLLNSL